ncbi:MAG: DUF481 domain-containing protein [Myxococcota bacterium]
MKWYRLTATITALVCLALAPGLGLAEEQAEEEPGWTGSISAGVAVTLATTDTFGGNVSANATRDWEHHRVAVEGQGQLAVTKQKNDDNETKTRKNANAQSIKGEYRWKPLERFYMYNNHVFARDTIQRTRFLYSTSVGPGYRFWQADPKKRYFDAQTGTGYLHQEFLRSDIKDEDSPIRRDDTRDLAIHTFSFEHANVVGESIDILHKGSFVLPYADPGQFIATTEFSASLPLVFNWAFRNTFGFRWENEPASDADEATFTYTAGLEYKF